MAGVCLFKNFLLSRLLSILENPDNVGMMIFSEPINTALVLFSLIEVILVLSLLPIMPVDEQP